MEVPEGKSSKKRTLISVPDDTDDLQVAGASHDDGKREHMDAYSLLDGSLI